MPAEGGVIDGRSGVATPLEGDEIYFTDEDDKSSPDPELDYFFADDDEAATENEAEPPASAWPNADDLPDPSQAMPQADDRGIVIESRPPKGSIPIGTRLNDNFVIKRFLGSGGMGEVYEAASDRNKDQRIAVKFILPYLLDNPRAEELFWKEITALSQLSHGSIVKCHLGMHDPKLNRLYFSMEYINGVKLSDSMGTMTFGRKEIETLLRWLSLGLIEMHRQPVYHRDIAPDNIMLPDGDLGRAKLIDFGIVKDPSKSIGVLAGKLDYMAPEQLHNKDPGPWSDIYSLGLVILSMARGKPVFNCETNSEAEACRAAVPDLSALPRELRPLFKRMLSPRISDRPKSAAEVIAELDRIAAAPKPRLFVPWSRLSWPAMRRWHWAGAGIAAVLATLIVYRIVSPPVPAPLPTPPPAPPIRTVRLAVERAIQGLPCSWLDQDQPSQSGGSIQVSLSGVAPASASLKALVRDAVSAAGIRTTVQVDTARVMAADSRSCKALDVYRAFREPSSARGPAIVPEGLQYQWKLDRGVPPVDCNVTGEARIDTVLDDLDPGRDVALLQVDSDGAIGTVYFADRDAFNRKLLVAPKFLQRRSDGRYDLRTCVYNTAAGGPAGLVALLLLKGDADAGDDILQLVRPQAPGDGLSTASAKLFQDTGRWQHWTAQMVWFRLVD